MNRLTVKVNEYIKHNYYIAQGKYRVICKIGNGAFGVIYLGADVKSGKEVAIKFEDITTYNPRLLYEYKVYRFLREYQINMHNDVAIPQVYYYGQETFFNVLVMELLGPSLEDLFNFCGRHFSMKTILMLADQMFNRLEFMHDKCFIHRDIKPDNFLMGCNTNSYKLFLIDFGLAKKYRSTRTLQHIYYSDNKTLVGTARYASINTHSGIQQSRRDDMESLGYVLLYLNRGKLPWQDLKASNKKQKYERIFEMKLSTSLLDLCKGFPGQFEKYLSYCRTLRFNDTPDYEYVRQLFR